MTAETVDCFNCGRENPEWAQVCRSCGVALMHGQARIAPASRFPTDQSSLISIGAVLGTILLAVLLGLFVSGLNPTEPTVGLASPSATAHGSGDPSVAPSVAASAAASSAAPSVAGSAAASAVASAPPASPSAPPGPRGTLAFGTGIDANNNVTGPTDTFTASSNFAYSVNVPGGIGGTPMRNVIERTSEPQETVVEGDQIPVDPAAETIGYSLGSAAGFIQDWGPGDYVWRIFVGEELIAEATFRLSEG